MRIDTNYSDSYASAWLPGTDVCIILRYAADIVAYQFQKTMTIYTKSFERPNGLESYRTDEKHVSEPIIDADSRQAAAAQNGRSPVIIA